MIPSSEMIRLVEGLHEHLILNELQEFTLEANPATFKLKKAQTYQHIGINRVSLGVQSFDLKTLQTLGRDHLPVQAVQAYHLLRDAGIPQVNIDLMYSVPGLSLSQWQETLQTTIKLHPDHISAYNLTYEEDTPFFDSLQAGDLDFNDDRDAEHYTLTDQLLCEAGYRHYETSNFAKPGFESIHNQSYWEGNHYLGLGPSAVSTIGSERWSNIADTAAYQKLISSVGHAKTTHETIDPQAYRIERIALQLRTLKGVSLSHLSESVRPRLEQLQSLKLLTILNDRVVLINDGKMHVDTIASELI